MSPTASGFLRLRWGAGGGVGEGVSASSPPHPPLPTPITRSLGLSVTHSDSGPMSDGAGVSCRLRQAGASCPNGADPAPDAVPGGCRAQEGARAGSSSPEPVSRDREPRGARAWRATAASPGSRDSGNGVSRPGGGNRGRVGGVAVGPPRVFTCLTRAARPRSPPAAGLLCPDPDVWRVLGGRE